MNKRGKIYAIIILLVSISGFTFDRMEKIYTKKNKSLSYVCDIPVQNDRGIKITKQEMENEITELIKSRNYFHVMKPYSEYSSAEPSSRAERLNTLKITI